MSDRERVLAEGFRTQWIARVAFALGRATAAPA
jgi:hypothetical protein